MRKLFERIKNIREEQKITMKDNESNRDIESKLAQEIKEYYISVSNAATRVCYNEYSTKKHLKKFSPKSRNNPKILAYRGLDIVLQMYDYCLCNDITDFKDLHTIISQRTLVEKLVNKNFNNKDSRKIMLNYDNSLKQIIGKDKEIKGSSQFERAQNCGFIELYENFRNRNWDYIAFGLIFNKYKYNFNNFNNVWLDLGEGKFGRFYDGFFDEALFFTIQYEYAFLFISYLIMLRKYDVFIQNEKVMSILEQIKKNNKSRITAFQEFYLVYSSLYKNEYESEFTYDEIAAFIMKEENIKKREMFMSCDYYSKEINICRHNKDFDKLIDSIDINVFLKEHVKKDPYIEEDRAYLGNDLFDYLMIKLMYDLSDIQFLDILFSKAIYINRMLKGH